jgi:hypothetical protein
MLPCMHKRLSVYANVCQCVYVLVCGMLQAVREFPTGIIPEDVAATIEYDPASLSASEDDAASSSYLRDREGPATCSLVGLRQRQVTIRPVIGGGVLYRHYYHAE